MAFLAAYQPAFESLDAARICRFFHAPSMGVGDGVIRVVLDEGELSANFSKVMQEYRSAGVTSTECELVSYRAISLAILEVEVHWRMRCGGGRLWKELSVVYVLLRSSSEPKIVCVYWLN